MGPGPGGEQVRLPERRGRQNILMGGMVCCRLGKTAKSAD
jgi:hypothetical protein